MARALRAWAINRGGKNLVRNLQYGPRTRLVRGMYILSYNNCKIMPHVWVHVLSANWLMHFITRTCIALSNEQNF